MTDEKVNLERAMVWLDAEIAYHQKRHDSSVNMGWADKAQLSDEFLKLFNTIRSALIEHKKLKAKMGKWKKLADYPNETLKMMKLDGWCAASILIRKIRDFKLDGEENPSPPAKGE